MIFFDLMIERRDFYEIGNYWFRNDCSGISAQPY